MLQPKSLTELADKFKTDKGTLFHNYTPIYEKILTPMRNLPIRLLEIGTDRGGSLQMWQSYFTNASIFGYDLRVRRKVNRLGNSHLFLYQGDQSSREDLQKFINKHGTGFDIIIDDGSHRSEHIFASLGFLFQHLKSGGIYFIEDLHAELAHEAQDYFKVLTRDKSISNSFFLSSEEKDLKSNLQECIFIDNKDKLFKMVRK